ncbi:MAG: ATP-binding protein [Spirochaetaceae bacterium]|nr:ATP-binding protein [Spirochaetaceae bacterium]
MKRQTVFLQLFVTLILLVAASVASTGYFGIKSLRTYAIEDAGSRQWELVLTLASLYERESDEYSQSFSSRKEESESFISYLPESLGYRITIIAADGRVLADTHEDARTMDNHGNRPEVREAVSKGRGSSIRTSDTLGGVPLIYTAYYDSSLSLVFRVARTVEGLQAGLDRSIRAFVVFAVLLISVSVVVSILAARRISQLLHSVQIVADHYARGDFSKVLTLSGFQEADVLSRTINRMGRQLRDTIMALEFRREELQSMLEGMTAPVVLLDRKLDIRKINPAASKLLGIETQECIGKGMLSVFRSPELYDLARKVMDGEDIGETLIRLDSGGPPVYLQTNASIVQGRGADDTGCLLVMNDITRITQLEMMRKDFVANVSHELRTPITSILGFVETLRQSENIDTETRDGFLEIIHRQAFRLEHIIGDLMALSRLEEGESGLVRETVGVRELFQGAMDTLAFKADARNTQIQLDVRNDETCCVHPILAEQALVNLLENAIKYSPEGSHVTLSSEVNEEEVVFIVRDDGPGIPESELTRIFERFHRLDKARSREMGGTGLGLAIVKHIAIKHGGRVWVESRLGKGCAFHIAFPHGSCDQTSQSTEK